MTHYRVHTQHLQSVPRALAMHMGSIRTHASACMHSESHARTANAAILCSHPSCTVCGEHVTSDHDAAPARAICMPTGRQKTARVADKMPCKQQLSPSKLCPHKLLHAPPPQHSTRDRMDGRTDGRSRRQSSRKLPFANGLADLHETKCSLTFCKMARAMEPTPTSDRHRNRPNSDPLLSLTGVSSSVVRLGRVGMLRWRYQPLKSLANAPS